MLELAMHILDIAENSVRAGATVVTIDIREDEATDSLVIEITDNGEGMDKDELARALDPFYTTKTVRRIGLGLPMLKEACRRCDGTFTIESSRIGGTKVVARFRHSHIDRQPLGNMASTMLMLITGNPDMDFIYTHTKNGAAFSLNTRTIKETIEDVPVNNPEIVRFIRNMIDEGLEEIGAYS
ncbi:MAG: sensor histidine kinase [Deltaproteobacteria bacterium]|nr:sensor histidine kinase [Deltaproteobacteria bacterium]MBN2686856.1 sensor histidine kinase [Deltaproteobacteria bacterium]